MGLPAIQCLGGGHFQAGSGGDNLEGKRIAARSPEKIPVKTSREGLTGTFACPRAKDGRGQCSKSLERKGH